MLGINTQNIRQRGIHSFLSYLGIERGQTKALIKESEDY
jgi:hypothetical protein